MATKRANGEGSIRKRSDGRWEARYVSPKDGRQRSLYGKTQKEVRQKLTQVMSEIDGGLYVDPAKLTVSEWLDMWLKEFCGDLKDTTKSWYAWSVDAHIRPAVGQYKLDALSKVMVQRFVNELAEDGLAPSTVNTIKVVLSSALQTAVDMEMIRANPCAAVKTQKRVPEKMNIIDQSMMAAFVAAAAQTNYGNAIRFALLTGMRFGELRGLRWQDVDLDHATITIQRQLAYANKAYFIQTPKNGRVRSFRMSQTAVQLLKDQRLEQQKNRLLCGADWIEDDLSHDLVFRMPDGSHYKLRALNYAVKKAGEAVGLPDITPHDLRHSFAVAAIRSGIDIKTIQTMLGHSSAAVTLDVYAHYTQDMGKVAADKLDAYIEQALRG